MQKYLKSSWEGIKLPHEHNRKPSLNDHHNPDDIKKLIISVSFYFDSAS
jgi:hypothetical protein